MKNHLIRENFFRLGKFYKQTTVVLNWIIMAKYSKKAQEKIAEVMKEFKEGTLRSSSGDKVTERDQAIAIGISEAEQAGYKVPKQKKEPSSDTRKKKK